MNMGASANTTYKPRGSGGVNKNAANYKPEQIEFSKQLNSKFIHFFGYAADGKETNTTPMFDYEGKAPEEHVTMMNQYKEMNKKAFALRTEQVKKEQSEI